MQSSSATETVHHLGQKVFTHADQLAFARLSGDVNPMHLDPIAARRLISGRQVVHGVHLMLQLLERFAASMPQTALPGSLECSFDHPVSVGDNTRFDAGTDAVGRTVLTVSADGRPCAAVTLDDARPTGLDPLTPVPRARDLTGLAAPLDEQAGSQAGTEFVLLPPTKGFTEAFPSAVHWLGLPTVAALAGLSYVVGMAVPGLHSVFSSLVYAPGSGSELRLQVRRWDPRFRLFIVDFRGALEGELRAFLRPPPQAQPGMRELAAHVQPREFAGTRSLVVGGSRGLGEVVAKLLAAGDGEVTVTYASGRDDGLRVAADIGAAGTGKAHVLALDLGGPHFEPPVLSAPPDSVYYFATPRIFRKKSGTFDAELFAEFTRFYLQRLSELCLWLEFIASTDRKITMYVPSSVFVDERPVGMTEYAMAKAAAEVLAEDLNRSLRRVRVLHSRLPRLATDQTASVWGASQTANNVEALLPIVRQVSGLAG